MKFSIRDFFSKYDQIRSFLWIWSHLLKKALMENFVFCAALSRYIVRANIEITPVPFWMVCLSSKFTLHSLINSSRVYGKHLFEFLCDKSVKKPIEWQTIF